MQSADKLTPLPGTAGSLVCADWLHYVEITHPNAGTAFSTKVLRQYTCEKISKISTRSKGVNPNVVA